jgi:hypothetical protein
MLIMNQVNYDFLRNDLKFLGFGEGLQPELKEALETEHQSFELLYQHKIEDDAVEATLYFTRPDPDGYFFFSKYEMRLDKKKHSFFIFKGKGITVKEAYNLLNGRAVYKLRTAKNGQKYNEWVQLDLQVKDEEGFRIIIYPESHGFDLSTVVDSFQIETPSANWDQSMFIRSLEKGNLQAAFIRENGAYRKVYVQADPGNRTLLIHETKSPFKEEMEETKLGDDIEHALDSKKSKARKLKGISK